ncbi:BppU family phage baseplate upper protein [Bacillus cereus]|uniref:BppU family phage baseplate upper protein n=1 Tax=Bacillus cereus TaxID=1396 RepID=UPI0018F7A6BF|nr:BppU family phage baseplate upper protein [Bacillus cereus]MBJ7955791.1 BppU family phage baseplate upper protein [Bacillus cereus]
MKIKLVLDINKTQQAQLNAVVTGRQGDKATVTVNVFVVDGGVPYNLTGNTVYYEGLKPNNAYVRDTSGVKMINATQGNFEYTFRPETFGVAGIGKRSYFSIEQGGTIRASTQDFGLVTLADAMTGNTMSDPYISELEELINLAQWLVDDINSRWTSINTQLTQLQNKLNTMDVVKRSGDTMTGNLLMDVGGTSRRIEFVNGATKLAGLYSSPTRFLFQDIQGNSAPWEYDYTTKSFNINGATNVVKKAGDTMTGDLKFGGTTARQITSEAGTGKLVFGSSGLWIEDSNGGNTVWNYRYSDKQFIVSGDTNLIKTTGGTMSGALSMRSSVKFESAGGGQAEWTQDTTQSSARGLMYYNQNAPTTIAGGFGRFLNPTNDTLYMGWGSTPWIAANSLTVSDSIFTYKGKPVAMRDKDGQFNLTLTADATNANAGYTPIADRRGNTVTVRMEVTRNAGAANTLICTLPADLRPANTLSYNFIANDGSLVGVNIKWDGSIDMFTTGKTVKIVATYVVN